MITRVALVSRPTFHWPRALFALLPLGSSLSLSLSLSLSPCPLAVVCVTLNERSLSGHFRGTWRTAPKTSLRAFSSFYVYCLTQLSRLFYCLPNFPLAFSLSLAYRLDKLDTHTGHNWTRRTQLPLSLSLFLSRSSVSLWDNQTLTSRFFLKLVTACRPTLVRTHLHCTACNKKRKEGGGSNCTLDTKQHRHKKIHSTGVQKKKSARREREKEPSEEEYSSKYATTKV